ncbi:MAG: Cytochrome c [Verrucomicrobiaceae bacterium]|nr:Cytochrome c [Verrucomicrobiaceae bacterium]
MTTRVLLLLATTLALKAEDFPTPFNTEKATEGPMPAEEVARTMQLPPGFKCQVFAAEPDVQQPIAMTFDARGRLWVAENYTYAENPKRWDLSLRDRITILEDKDGDGKMDSRKVFWDKGTYLTSLEIGYGGVWVLSGGTLSFIADKDGDDVPDGEPQVLLDGFNVTTIGHNIVNGLRWGPDGWLYGRHGITSDSLVGAPGTPPDQRTRFNCAIWRFHPITHKFEIVCQGGTNSWGHDWDANGELFFINTVIGHLWHGIPGAYYRRMFGTHLNQHAYEYIEQTADHFHWDTGSGEKWSDAKKGMSSATDAAGGGHAHVGMLIYQGGTWPEEYNGAMLTCNLHGNRINVDRLERLGNGYVGKHAPDFAKTKDKWFRGLDLITGPDGNVFVNDWSDTGECHDSDGVHRTSGRIYKISYGDAPKISGIDLAKMSDEELKKHLSDKNSWWARTAEHLLRERGKFVDPDTTDLLTSKDEHSRAKGIDLLVAQKSNRLPQDDPSGLVRLHLASALQKLPAEARFPLATALALHAEDAGDRQQPLMIWYGVEAAVVAHPKEALALIASAKIPTVRRLVSRRLAEEMDRQPALADDLVALALKPEGTVAAEDIVKGLSQALQGYSKAAKPAQWDKLAEVMQAHAGDDIKNMVRELSSIFGSGRATEELVAIAENAEADAGARINAVNSLLRSPKPALLPLLKGWIKDKVLAAQAVRGLASFDDPTIPGTLLGMYKYLPEAIQGDAVNTLISRPAYARQLLERIEKGGLPAKSITPFQARQISSFNDEALNKLLAKVWGGIREAPEAKKQEQAKYKGLLTPAVLARADAGKGRTVFAGVCAACHKLYGEGAAIGPELTGSDRHNINYLLENVVDPNAVVPNDFRLTILKMKDGRVLSGVIPEQTERTITIVSPAQRLQVERQEVASSEQLPLSLMPEGLLQAMTIEQVQNLFAYLMSNGQVEMSQTP